MRLVEDQPPIGRQNSRARIRRLRQHKRVVHHHHMRLERTGTRLRDEALLAKRTRPPRAVFRWTRQLRTQLLVAEVVQIAVLRLMQPLDQCAKRLALIFRQRPVAALHVFAQHPQAQIVRTPLQQRRAELRRLGSQGLRRPRQIARDELTLQIAGRRRHDNRRVIDETPLHRGNEIGQRLANARSRLDHQMLARVEGPRDRARHLQLTGTRLVPVHRPKGPSRLEMGGDVLDHQRRAVLMCRQAALRPARRHVGQEVRPVRVVHERRRIGARGTVQPVFRL